LFAKPAKTLPLRPINNKPKFKKMKKNLLILAAAFGCVALTACNNDDPAEALTYDAYQTATIQGKVLVNSDETLTDPKWSAPTNLTVVAEVSNASITGQYQATGDYRVEAVCNTSTGEYSVEIPVSNTGSQVRITVKDFPGTVKVRTYDSVQDAYINVTRNVVWRSRQINASVKPGDVSINNNLLFNGSSNYTVVPDAGSEIN
jgi:hypothetical protein